jgi:hypothetical protein
MHLVRKYHLQINRFVCSSGRGAFFLAFALLAGVMAALAALIFRFGAPAMNGRPWDLPVVLDGAWRIVSGQVPHRDFYSYFGFLPFYMTALGMKISRPCVSAIDYGNVVLMAGLVLAAMAVLRRRTSALAAFLFSLFIGLLVITPRPLGDPYDYIDHAMLYNRYGEACIALFGVVLFLPPRPEFAGNWTNWLESVFAGFLLILLLGCKLNYFIVGIGFFGLARITGRISVGWALACVVGAAAFLVLGLALSKIPLSDLINDYRIMSACQKLGGRIRGLAIQGAKNILWLPVLLLAVWEGFLGNAEQAEHRPAPWRHILVVAGIFGGAALLLSSNSQLGEMPLLAVAALYGAEMVLRQGNATAESPFFVAARHLGVFLLFLLFVLPPIAGDLNTIRFVAATALKKKWDSTETLQSTSLNDYRFVRGGTRKEEMQEYMAGLDEGIQLLRRHSNPEMRLNAILFSDPFHVALGLIPASGGTLCLDDTGVTKQSHPPLARLLGNSTHLLTTRGSELLKAVYGAEWRALNLEIVEESKNYTLLKIPEGRGNR